MAIQPIDLQTMYSQMNNVAKTVAVQQQGGQLTQAMQEAQRVQQNSEQAAQVHKAADSESKSGQVNKDGHDSQEYNPQGNKKREKEEEQLTETKTVKLREAHLGNHIDIMG